MKPLRLIPLLIACALFALVAAGCEKGEDLDPVREGIATDVNGLDYNVFITRQLNPRDVTDRDYFNGAEQAAECADTGTDPVLTPDERVQQCPTALFGVFLEVCNETTDEPVISAREPIEVEGREFPGSFEIEDAQGNTFEPLPLPRTNVFAYRSGPIPKGECTPREGSAAATSPTGGALLVFRLPIAATENRPLELSISTGGETQHFELDI